MFELVNLAQGLGKLALQLGDFALALDQSGASAVFLGAVQLADLPVQLKDLLAQDDQLRRRWGLRGAPACLADVRFALAAEGSLQRGQGSR